MNDHVLQFLGFIIAGIIFWRAESILNIMASNCFLPVRLAFWCMVVGAFGLTVIIIQGYVPPVMVLLLTAGLALLLMTERRIGTLLRMQTPITVDRRTRP